MKFRFMFVQGSPPQPPVTVGLDLDLTYWSRVSEKPPDRSGLRSGGLIKTQDRSGLRSGGHSVVTTESSGREEETRDLVGRVSSQRTRVYVRVRIMGTGVWVSVLYSDGVR